MKEPNVFQRFIAKLSGMSAPIWSYIKTHILPILISRAGKVLMASAEIAGEFVLEAAKNRNWTGDQKKEWVRDQVKQELLSQGIVTAEELAHEVFPNSVFDGGIQDVVTRMQVEGIIK